MNALVVFVSFALCVATVGQAAYQPRNVTFKITSQDSVQLPVSFVSRVSRYVETLLNSETTDNLVISLDQYPESSVSYIVNDYLKNGREYANTLEGDMEHIVGVLQVSDFLQMSRMKLDASEKLSALLREPNSNISESQLADLEQKLSHQLLTEVLKPGSSGIEYFQSFDCDNAVGRFMLKYVQEMVISSRSTHFESLSKCLVNLKHLEIASLAHTNEIVEILSNATAITQLSHLTLNDWTTDADVEKLASIAHLKSLKKLELSNWYSRLSMNALKSIAESEHIRNLESLSFFSVKVGNDGAKMIANSANFKNLVELTVTDASISNNGIAALSYSPNLSNLKHLCLCNNQIDDKGVESMCLSKYLNNLEFLDLANNEISNGGAVKLARSENFRNLTFLNLSYNKIGNDGAIALGESKTFPSLKDLYLNNNEIQMEGAVAIVSGKNFTSFNYLSLLGNNLNKENIIELQKLNKSENLFIRIENDNDSDQNSQSNEIDEAIISNNEEQDDIDFESDGNNDEDNIGSKTLQALLQSTLL